jgi:predicted glycosyltransferase
MSQALCEAVNVNDFQYENLIKAVELCMKQNYCALYFEDLVNKFCPEISEEALRVAVRTLDARGQIWVDDTLLRLVIR